MKMTPLPRRALFTGALAACLAAPFALAPSIASAEPPSGYTQTQYPVVLVHGLFGFDQIGPVDYFYGVPKALRDGGATVYTPPVSAANSNEERGEQLLRTLRQLKAAYGYTKFNLIGHSQGGTTARYVAAVAPELVASVTTVGTPHAGSKVADALVPVAGTPVLGSTVVSLVNGFAQIISTISGSPSLPQDAAGALQSLNSSGAADFNRRFPQGAPGTQCGTGAEVVNDVRYYSASGTSVLTNALDISDPVLLLSSLAFGVERNDGLVGQCSSHWGSVLKDDYGWNHLDESNQAFGLRGVFAADPVAFYRSQANRLKSIGL